MNFHYSKWLETPLPTRIKIAELFDIKKLRSTHVMGDQILDDGYNIKDVEEGLSVMRLQVYLDTPEVDMNNLFTLLVNKIEGKEEVKPEPVIEQVSPIAPIEVPKKRGRPFKNKQNA